MHVTEAKMSFAPPKIYFAALCGAFFYMGVVIYAQIHKMLLKYMKCCSNLATLRKCAYLNNISRIWATFCIEEDNLQKGNAFWGEENYISVQKSGGRNIASETTFDHWKVVFLMSKSEKKWEKGAMKPLLRHSIGQRDLKTVVRSNFRPEMAEK